ncbi:MAG: serine/threonine protein kinase [Pyrinomonadaceae bacterium]|nr:serine/threonine protein kinase [Pyrinomonadaceae bacterium]MBP6211408.1 serine/threonine protein kinase [Pyrinomonadaceae bacterium]
MHKADWAHIKELFHQTLGLNAAERAKFLAGESETVRREVAELIASHESAEDFIARSAADEYGLNTNALIGKQIGSYTLLEVVGTGGMGTVFRASRDGFEKEFAVKLIKRGMDTDAVLRRFQLERRILSRLEHPNIAGLLDGGTTDDGLPYFVLEFVDGVPVTRFCDDRRLDVRERIELFRRICSAVSYAHQNLVVHRDLKPSNILVTADGTPKLLDFGIAKMLGSEETEATATQARMFTPEYASPEQLNGLPVTTASDVYSLGVVLYEMLSGQRPFRSTGKSYQDIVNRIMTEEPARPSSFFGGTQQAIQGDTSPDDQRRTGGGSGNDAAGVHDRRSLEGDLDNIILKALRKEPERRYQSVQEFSEDIRRHLSGLPVTATADTRLYRLSKFVARHRMSVAAGSFAAVLIFAISGIAVWQGITANRERAKAERRFEQVRKLANAMIFDYQDEIERLPGTTPIRQKMVSDAIIYLDNLAAESGGDASLRGELASAYDKIGDIQGNPFYANLGDMDGALASYNKALAIREDLLAGDPGNKNLKFNLSLSLGSIGDLHWAKGEYPSALEKYRRALEMAESVANDNPSDAANKYALAHRHYSIGQTLRKMGDLAGALDSFGRSLEFNKVLLEGEPGNVDYRHAVAVAYLKTGDVYFDSADLKSALDHHQKATEVLGPLLEDDSDATSKRELTLFLNRIAIDKRGLGDINGAVEADLRAIAVQSELTRLDPKNEQSRLDLATYQQSLAESYATLGKRIEAFELFTKAIAVYEDALKKNPDDAEVADALNSTRRSLANLEPSKK